jgi:enolase-phosphatase E1
MIGRRAKSLLIDIEGTTSSIAFVYDIMFPYVRKHVASFLERRFAEPAVEQACRAMAQDAGFSDVIAWRKSIGCSLPGRESLASFLAERVQRLMDSDSKTTGLKALQGLIWQAGFASGELQSHLYPDVYPALQRWRDAGIGLNIYSSGSVVAQKLFFGHTLFGDLTPCFHAHFDTTIGSKREASSYTRIAQHLALPAADILFLSDVVEEVEAALVAGMQAVAVVRPGNKPLPEAFGGDQIHSFDELHLEFGAASR